SALGPRWLDGVLGRVIEVLFALPSLVLALLLVAVLGAGVRSSVIAVGLATAPRYARILRSRAQGVVRSPYVLASRLEGRSGPAVFVQQVLPDSVLPLVAVATLGSGQAIIGVSARRYLGLGTLPPRPRLAPVHHRRLVDDGGTRPGDPPHSHRADGAGPADLCGGPGMSAREGTMLDVAGLSVSFPAGPVLQGVDLQLQAGRCLAIVGE